MRIAASDEATCSSPAAMSGSGTTISTRAYTASQRHRPRTDVSTPDRAASATTATAASARRAQERKPGESPS